MTDILYEEKPFNDVDVKAATVDKLIRHCLEKFDGKFDSADPGAFVNVFFLTYHWYLTTEDLLGRFIDVYDKGKDDDQNLSIYIYKAVKYWLDNYGYDFERNQNALSLLNILNTKILDNNGFTFTLNLDDWNVSKKSNKMRLESDKRRSSLNFNDMPADELGEQLVYLSWKSLKKIPVGEWMKYGKSAKTTETPLLKEQIGLFNDTSKYVMAMILNRLSSDNRAKSIDKFIKTCKRLLQLQDYNTLLAVLGGLEHSAIVRLQKTRDLLSNESKLFLKETTNFLSSQKNYQSYRTETENKTGFIVPILGVIMKDLVALETAVPTYIEHESRKLIHFHKLVQVYDILKQILSSRMMCPQVAPKKEIFNVMRVSLRSRYSEDDLYEMSLQREPRIPGSGSLKTPKLSTGGPVFADWALGQSQEIPDRETVEKYVQDMVEAVFKTYDLDKNGSINKSEFDALASNFPFIHNFAVLDVNCDGNISRQEMLNYFMKVNSQQMSKEFLHDFQEHSFYSPHYCVYCMGFLWGIGKSGYKCKVCQISCHKDCKDHVVMECRPNRTLSMRSSSTLEKPSKSQRKRLKYVDLDWRGSTDSQLSHSDSDCSASPRIKHSVSTPNGDVFSQSFDGGDTTSLVSKLKERINKLEMEKDWFRKENSMLKSKLSSTETQVGTLQSQLSLVRQQSVKFMLEQMERLNTCKETDV